METLTKRPSYVTPSVSPITDDRENKIDLFPRRAETRPEVNAEKEDGMKPSAAVAATKRALDIVAGLAGTAVFLIAYPILALLIKLESPGPVLYLQSRVGRDRRGRGARRSREALPPGTERRWQSDRRRNDVGGRIFTIYKFRSMRIDAESRGPQLCGKAGDSRVTRVGRVIRSLHLDELPQFWNVLKGDMSFIGPRPERPHFTLQYAKKIPMYAERTRHLKPGLTGVAQITLGYDDSLESVIRKTHYDLAYRASLGAFATWLRLEAWVVFNTLVYLLKRAPLAEVASFPAGADPSLRPQPAALAMALINRRKGLKPALVLTRGRAQARARRNDLIVRAARSARPAAKPVPAETPAAPVANFLSVDVECWFHAHNLAIPKSQWDAQPTRVVENVRRILDLLKARDAKATFFVLGWVADRFPEVVRMIDAAGQEIGTHGYLHDKVTDMSPYEFEKDLDRSLDALARLTSRKVVGHRASNFSIVGSTLWALDILAKYGIEYDSSIFPVKRDRYGIPAYPNRMPHVVELAGGASIREVPLSTLNFGARALPIAGGGYLRLYPQAFTEMFLRRRNRQGLPGMVYFHPWELDRDQKRIDVGLLKTFQHYVNLDTTETKISRLLETFRFTSIRDNLQSEAMQSLLAKDAVRIEGSQAVPAAASPAAPSLAAARADEAPAQTSSATETDALMPKSLAA